MSNAQETGVSLAPIAPPLEFPYGSSADDGSAHERLDDAQHPPKSMPGDKTMLPQTQRPMVAKSMTEQALPGEPPRRPLPSRKTFWAASRTKSQLPANEARPKGKTTRGVTNFGHGNVASGPSNRPGIGPYPGYSFKGDQVNASGKVSKRDGRVNITFHEAVNAGYLAKAVGGGPVKRGTGNTREGAVDAPSDDRRIDSDGVAKQTPELQFAGADDRLPIPKLNIVIMVIGSRGDIQPFLKIGKVLKERYGHRVRIATHPAFKEFVEKDTDLEFFSVGGDPAELMAFMVKNPGLIPSLSAVKAGEIGRKRDQMFQMFQGFWRACINATDEETDAGNKKMMQGKNPFVAHAIIANPPCFAHVHCAERLGVPLHLMFTFPQTPTSEFPNPLANIKKTNIDPAYTNFMSYPLVEMITWQGLGDLVNLFRVKTLGLEPVSTLWAPGQLYRQKVPFTYLWSPGLIPKPKDWGPEIDIAGFVFLELASSFKPPEDLVQFLEAGPEPIYIGFGSIVVDDPDRFTSIIFEAVKRSGVRALVSKGWGGLGSDDKPENVYMLDNTPHDWIFPKVSAVIHHGGAGTSAIGLKCGKPTMVVPFFGDQPFWGAMIAKAGAGHEPVPYKQLTVEKLVEGIQVCLSPEAKTNAKKLAESIAAEGDGARNAVESFHRSLPLRGEKSMRCAILEDRVAVWRHKKTDLRMSALAADILVQQRRLAWKSLRLLRYYEWNDFTGPGEPVTGAGAAFIRSVSGVAKGVGGMPIKVVRRVKHHEKQELRRWRKSHREMANASEDTSQKSELNGNANPADHQANTMSEVKEADDYTSDSSDNDEEGDDVGKEILKDIGKSLEQSGGVLLKAPMDISLAVAQGFHNAPRLYGDTSVRRAPRITGLHSGLRAAGEEFVYGIYDGVTGLVVQPYHGARDAGLIGLMKGVGKGVGGFILKDFAAIIGPFGYTLKGIHKELQKGKQPTAFIRRSHVIQGQNENKDLTGEDREVVMAAIDRAWKVALELEKLMHNKKEHGIKGRIELMQTEKKFHEYGAFENVAQVGKALEATKKGEDFDKVFNGETQETKAEAPRESVMVQAKGTDARGQEVSNGSAA